MGSYHIIDGEKVTIRYPGQEWSCARCHHFKRSCPGQAIAKDCTAERALLSSHMENHWRKMGFNPETKSDSEVDDVPDLNIQVGQPKTLGQDSSVHEPRSGSMFLALKSIYFQN